MSVLLVVLFDNTLKVVRHSSGRKVLTSSVLMYDFQEDSSYKVLKYEVQQEVADLLYLERLMDSMRAILGSSMR
jgi:hypothetical protein